MLFCVRGTWGGESVCKGTDKTRFVREPVCCPSSLRAIHRTPTLLKTTKRWAPAVVSTEHMLASLLRRLLLTIMAIVSKLHIYVLARLMGYRSFLPQRDSILVTCCTNGLGHVHQMERVLSVLQQAGLEFPVIALAKEQKVPQYKIDSLKARFPGATFVNLNLEVDYDNGKSFNNRRIVVSATKTVLRRSTPFYRRIARLMMHYRPSYCLSFWEPGVAMFINAMNCPTKLVCVCSQVRDPTSRSAKAVRRPSMLARLGVLARVRSMRTTLG